MTTSAMNAMAGFDWLKRGVNLGRNNPKAVFGGAALLMVAVLAVLLAAGLLAGLVIWMLGDSVVGMVLAGVLVTVAVLVLMGMLMVGYLRLIHAVESGGPARAMDVFAGFGDATASLRMIGFMVVLTIAQNLLLFGLLAVFAGGVVEWYAQAVQASAGGDQAAMMANLPDGLGLAYLIMAVIGLVCFGIQAIGIGQIALGGKGVFAAFGDGLAGAFKNVLPLLVLFVSYLVAMIVLMIVVVLLVLLLGLLTAVIGDWFAIVIGVPLYFLFLLAACVIAFGTMYHLWRDVCGGDDVAQLSADALTA